MKVAFITDAPKPAGSETWLAQVTPRLLAYGIESTVFLPARPALQSFAKRLASQVEVVVYQKPGELKDLTAQHDLRFLQGWFPAFYARVLPALEHPKVLFEHDQLERHFPLGLGLAARSFYSVTKAAYLSQVDLVMSGTYWAAEYLHTTYGISRVKAIPSGVDFELFAPKSAAWREQKRAQLGAKGFAVLVPARFAPEKNHLAVLGTARLAPEIQFLLAGGGGELEGLIHWLAARWHLDNVVFLGQRSDMPELYPASDAVFLPTLADNPGLVIMEAMAAGVPVVTSAFPPQEEIMSSEHGFLVSPKPAACALALRQLASDPELRTAMGQAGRQHVQQTRTLTTTVELLAQTLLEFAPEKN